MRAYFSDRLLGILAIDAFVERLGYLHRIEDDVKALLSRSTRFPLHNRDVLNAEENFTKFVDQGRDILLSGATLSPSTGAFKTFIRQRVIERRKRFRFLLLNPHAPDLEFIAQSHGLTAQTLRNDIDNSLANIASIIKDVPESKRNLIQVRLIDTIPLHLAMRDGHDDGGVIRCEIHLHKVDSARRPSFSLTPTDEAYIDFLAAAENLWEDAKPWCRPIDTSALIQDSPPKSSMYREGT